MKIIGKNSLIYWIRFPFLIFVLGFVLMSSWIFILMINFIITKSTNQFTTKSSWNLLNKNQQTNSEIIQFHYPISKMVLATENSTEGICLAFIGLFSFCFILLFALKLIFKLSKDIIF